jgi:hypothetical protein
MRSRASCVCERAAFASELRSRASCVRERAAFALAAFALAAFALAAFALAAFALSAFALAAFALAALVLAAFALAAFVLAPKPRATLPNPPPCSVWETGSATAFPDGFNMIAYGSTPEAHMEVTCDGPSECERDDCSTDDDSFFPQTACSELEAKLVFPTCWDGVNLTSETMTTHVSYDTEGGWFDAECPDSHPVKLPEVHFYFRIANYLGGEYTFADGTSVYHADYFSGWDAEKLQQILDGCSNESDAASPDAFCEDLLDFRVEKETGKQTEDDDIRGGLEAIQTTQDPDMQRTVSTEKVDNIAVLPRGKCTGSVVDLDNIPEDGGGGEEGGGARVIIRAGFRSDSTDYLDIAIVVLALGVLRRRGGGQGLLRHAGLGHDGRRPASMMGGGGHVCALW